MRLALREALAAALEAAKARAEGRPSDEAERRAAVLAFALSPAEQVQLRAMLELQRVPA